MKPVVLECFGLPGAGKTTVIDEVVSRLKGSGWNVYDTNDLRTLVSSLGCLQKMNVADRYVALNHVVNVAWTLCSSPLVTRETIGRAARLPLHEAYLQLFLEMFDGEAICLDQWTVQAIWSTTVGLPGFVSHKLSKFLKNAVSKLPRLFLYFDIDVEETARRIVNRSGGESRFDGLDRVEIVRRLRNEEARMKYLLNTVETSGAEILRLDGSDPVASKVENAMEWISQHHRSRDEKWQFCAVTSTRLVRRSRWFGLGSLT